MSILLIVAVVCLLLESTRAIGYGNGELIVACFNRDELLVLDPTTFAVLGVLNEDEPFDIVRGVDLLSTGSIGAAGRGEYRVYDSLGIRTNTIKDARFGFPAHIDHGDDNIVFVGTQSIRVSEFRQDGTFVREQGNKG